MSDFSGLLLRRGPTIDRLNFFPLKGEIIYDSDNQTVYIGGLDESGEFKAGGLSVFGDRIKLSETIDYPGRENLDILLNTQGGVRVPRGTTEERPPTEVTEQGEYAKGMIRFNVDTNEFEGYDGTQWGGIGGSGGGGGGLGKDEVYFQTPPEFPEIGDLWFENSQYGEIFVWDGKTWISTAGGRTGQEINRLIGEINQKFGNVITQDNIGLTLQDLITRSQLAESLRGRIDLIPDDPIERSEAVTIAEDGARTLLASAVLAYDAIKVWQFGTDTEDWLGENVVLSVDLPGVLTLTPSSVSPRIYYNFKNNFDDVNDRGEWVAERNYVVDDVVTYAGVTYKCLVSHAAIVFQTALDLNYWEEFRFVNEEVDADVYKNISVKLKRKGGASWSGKLYWDNGDGLNLNRSVQINDPTVTSTGTALNEFVTASFDLTDTQTWTGTIKTIMLELGNFDNDAFDVDWIAVGNAAPANYSSAIQEEAFVRAEKDGLIGGQYTIKVDTGGYVTGFGLLSTNNPLKQQQDSKFIIRAEEFALLKPNGIDGEETVPFVISRVNGTDVVAINGQLNIGADSRTLEQTQEEISSSGTEIGEFASDPNPSSYNIGDVYYNTTDAITYQLGYNINGEKSWKIVTGALSRGPSVFYKKVSRYSWSDSEADAAITSAGQVKKRFDSVVLYNTTNAVNSNGKGRAFFTQKTWTGTSWETIELFVDGDAIVTGSLTANALSANTITGDKIQGGTISADKIIIDGVTLISNDTTGDTNTTSLSVGTINADHIEAKSVTADEIKAGTITADEIATNTLTADKIKLGDNTIIEDPVTGGIKVGVLTADQINVNDVIRVGGIATQDDIPEIPAGTVVTENTIATAIEAAITNDKTIIDGASITTGEINVGSVNLNGTISSANKGNIKIQGDVLVGTLDVDDDTPFDQTGRLFYDPQWGSLNAAASVQANVNPVGILGYWATPSNGGQSQGSAVYGLAISYNNTGAGVVGVSYGNGGSTASKATYGGFFQTTKTGDHTQALLGACNSTRPSSAAVIAQSPLGGTALRIPQGRVVIGPAVSAEGAEIALAPKPGQSVEWINDITGNNEWRVYYNIPPNHQMFLNTSGDLTVTGTYAPFTGSHNAFVESDQSIVIGDIAIDTDRIYKYGISQTTIFVLTSSRSYEKRVIGVFCEEPSDLVRTKQSETVVVDNFVGDEVTYESKVIRDNRLVGFSDDDIDSLCDEGAKLVKINALGEGQINVCGENGDIEAGDLIVTSNMPGKGMKQDDDLVRGCTVAKSRENVTFSSPDEVKQIACIYMCG